MKPANGWVKINCDASWRRESNTGEIGVIARNETGQVIGGANRRKNGWNIEALEAEALLMGVSLAREKQWEKVIFESDSETIM